VNYTQGGKSIARNNWELYSVEDLKDGSFINTGVSPNGLTWSNPIGRKITVKGREITVYDQTPSVTIIPTQDLIEIFKSGVEEMVGTMDELLKKANKPVTK